MDDWKIDLDVRTKFFHFVLYKKDAGDTAIFLGIRTDHPDDLFLENDVYDRESIPESLEYCMEIFTPLPIRSYPDSKEDNLEKEIKELQKQHPSLSTYFYNCDDLLHRIYVKLGGYNYDDEEYSC